MLKTNRRKRQDATVESQDGAAVSQDGAAVGPQDATGARRAPQLKLLRGLTASYLATNAIIVPFLPIYFGNQGYSPSQIGLLMMLGPFLSIFAQPFWGFVSDRYNTLKRIIALLWIMTVVASVGVFNSSSYAVTLIFMLALFFFVYPSTALLDSLSVRTAAEAGRSYGSIRLWGSVGFAAVALSSGAILPLIGGVEHVAYLYWGVWAAALLLLFFLKDEPGTGARLSVRQLGALLGHKPFLLLLAVSFLIMVPHRMNDVLFTLHLQELGGTDAMAGLGWALATLAEIPTFALLGRFLHRYQELALLGIAASLYVVRWLAYAWIDDPVLLIALQASHMVTFAVFWITGIHYAVKLAPESMRSTALALFSAVFLGLAGIVGGLAGGAIMDQWGGSAMYVAGAGLSLVAAVGLMAARWRIRVR
ncbi:MFS transporter [Paenibacillus sp. IB182496]|uniref:MFS transporter n=2 Tax=Paenibacillus sabuli TaxID=2772509 RepID=A0A927BTH7_9BACL|nr:MFS transporter [Paenibacillus sabuli]